MSKDREDRIKGVLTGQAVGDALGAPYEFRPPPERGQARFGVGTFGHEPGQYTDDTEQACMVAMGRAEPSAVARNLLAWYRSGPRDVGNATAAVLSRCSTPAGMVRASRAYAAQQASAPRPAHFHPGGPNGSLMRTGPVCLPYLGDRKRIAQAARKVSDLTHADPYCGDACVIWSLAIDRAVELGEAFTPSMVAGGLPPVRERRAFWENVIAEALSARQPSSQNGSAVGAFKCALWAVAHANGLADGLQLVISLGGDADTTGAIAGALLGAWHGASAVPQEWRDVLHGWPGMKAADLEALALAAAGLAPVPVP